MIRIENFTDPLCPFAWSAEPALRRLRWLYGDQIAWTPRMVVLSERPEDSGRLRPPTGAHPPDTGFTPAKLAAGMASIQARYGMPIDAHERPRITASVDACRAVVATRIHAPEHTDALLRRLRVLVMTGDLIDEPEVLDAAAAHAGLDPAALRSWAAEPGVEAALREDMRAARAPAKAALALDHKLAGPAGERRYTCPSLVLHAEGREPVVAPGFQPVEVYEVLVANLAPQLTRRPEPESAAEVLAWAREPLATAEVAAVMGRSRDAVRDELELVATADPLGPEAFWSLEERFSRTAEPLLPRR